MRRGNFEFMENMGWGGIIIMLFLCALCPFLVIPFMLFYGVIHDALAQHGKTFDDLFVIFQVVLLIFGVFFLALSPIWIIVIFASGSYNYMVEEESYMFIIFIVATAVEILISFFMVMPHLRKKIRFVDKTLKMFEK